MAEILGELKVGALVVFPKGAYAVESLYNGQICTLATPGAIGEIVDIKTDVGYFKTPPSDRIFNSKYVINSDDSLIKGATAGELLSGHNLPYYTFNIYVGILFENGETKVFTLDILKEVEAKYYAGAKLKSLAILES